MDFTPMWLVWIIAGAVGLIVFGLFLKERKPGKTFEDMTGVSLRVFFGIMIFGSSIFLGPLITGFASPTPTDWRQALAARATMHLGGVLLLVGSLIIENRRSGGLGDGAFWKMNAAFVAIAIAMSWSSVRDLAQGPVVLRGKATLSVEKTHGGRGGPSISALVHLTAPDGSSQEMDLSGWGASRAEGAFAQCEPGSDVDVTVLQHIGAVLDVVCR